MEVLLEIGCSKKLLSVTEETLLNVVERELTLMGDVSLLPFKHSPSDFPGASKEFYILQRWSEKWNAFVDIKDASEVSAGDRLTVVSCPKTSTAMSNVSLGCVVAIRFCVFDNILFRFIIYTVHA